MEYHARLKRFQAELNSSQTRFHQLGNARLITGVGALAIAGLSIGAKLFSAWWLLLPLVVFIALAIIHDRVDKARARSQRAVKFYEWMVARVENRWIGHGHNGAEFQQPGHLYSDDLDVLGPGSLFERISSARTTAGSRALSLWLLQAAPRQLVLERQEAVAELAPLLDLREDIAMMGDDVRTAIDDRAARSWGRNPAAAFFPYAKWVALALAIAAVVTLSLAIAQILSPRPFLAVVLAELIFGFAVRSSVGQVMATVATPSRELRLLGLLLEKLEQQPFRSPLLTRLVKRIDVHGLTPSAEIHRLVTLVERLDWARNQFFRVIASPLMWVPQCAMAIERWRADCGEHIGEWIAAVGEFEALCSLASFSYERHDAVWPDLDEGTSPLLHANAVKHPLLDPAKAVANDVTLDAQCPLWIISGSNMSGKSTLLRAAGLNVVLAWAGAPVCCGQLRVSRLALGASIRVNDSLADNRSRFYAEITRLRDIVSLTQSPVPLFFLLDELLSGTNSHDRRIGAASVVRGLIERGAIGFVTTHDLALAEIGDHLRARNVHFEDQMERGEMHFDYRLRPGVVERSNALELMRAVGLPV